jgi:hypothetical protein
MEVVYKNEICSVSCHRYCDKFQIDTIIIMSKNLFKAKSCHYKIRESEKMQIFNDFTVISNYLCSNRACRKEIIRQ